MWVYQKMSPLAARGQWHAPPVRAFAEIGDGRGRAAAALPSADAGGLAGRPAARLCRR